MAAILSNVTTQLIKRVKQVGASAAAKQAVDLCKDLKKFDVEALSFKLAQPQGREVYHTSLCYNEHCEISIFEFGASAYLPLHTHPGMVVLSLMLRGSMHAAIFDRSGLCTGNTTLLTGNTHITGPEDNNIHAFRAASTDGCAFLDVIVPPYTDPRCYLGISSDEDHPTDLPWGAQQGHKYNLQKMHTIPSVIESIVTRPYLGPKIKVPL